MEKKLTPMMELIEKINGMFRVCTDMIKTDAKDVEQEKLDNEYNLALTNVLNLFKTIECEHDWFYIKDEIKGNWRLCEKCKCWNKL